MEINITLSQFILHRKDVGGRDIPNIINYN